MNTLPLVAILTLGLLAPDTSLAAEPPPGLEAGAAVVEITPPVGGPMWGYGDRHDQPSEGVLDPLKAKALVLAVGEEKIALVGLDLGRAPPRDVTAAIRAKVKAAGVGHVFLVASHTHHGPVLELPNWPDAKKPYLRDLEDNLVEVITRAAKARRPARLSVASAQVELNRNRHSRLPDKPVDRELLVMKVEGEDGKAIATAVNFAAHPTILPSRLRKFSADWPGAMMAAVEKETGAPCLFLQGAEGDLSPNTGEPRTPEAFGQSVAKEVLKLLASAKPQPLQKGTLQAREDAFAFGSRIDLGNQAVRLVYETAFFPELVAFYEREYREGVRPQMTTALLDGRIGFVGVSGEFFCGHSLHLKKRARLEHLFFLGCCNDYQQYFPTIEASAEGGYGADARVSPAQAGAGERMMDRALVHLWKMRGRIVNLPPDKDDAAPTLQPKPAERKEYEKLAPYPAIRWKNEKPEVQLVGKWYALESIDDQPAEKIVKFAREKYGDRWQKRFDEDLVEVLAEMGKAPGKTVKLVVKDIDTGKSVTHAEAPMTKENRRAIMDFKYGTPRVPPKGPADLKQSVAEFRKLLDEAWSYRPFHKADVDAALAALEKKVNAGKMSDYEFGLELEKVLGRGLDGHSSVSGHRVPDGFLPFLVAPTGERLVAFKPDRSGFVEADYPFVAKIDGKDVGDWMKAAAAFAPRGSTAYVQNHSLRGLRNLNLLRAELGLEKKPVVTVELLARDGKGRKTVELPVASRSPLYGVWPEKASGLLEGNIGYLRLPVMDERTAVADIKKWMPKFRDTAGLIVDVRDNGGGTRDALRLLFSYLCKDGDAPHVVTAAVYRTHPTFPENHLAARFMYRATSVVWTDAEKKVIATFAKQFKPQWQPPRDGYSDWHYLVLRRLGDPDVFHYGKPVVVLLNGKCFSATDIFLTALKGWRNVTLAGTPSGGGSSFAHRYPLTGAPLSIRLGSIVSFQADGKLFDGQGIEPDVRVDPAPEYYIGGRDAQLEKALEVIKAK